MIQYIILIIFVIVLLVVATRENIKNSLLPYKPTYNKINYENANVVGKVENNFHINGNDEDCDTPKYLVKEKCESPNYLIEDETNFAKKQLYSFLKKVNKKSISLKSPCNYTFYNHATMDDLLRRTLDDISQNVIELLNKNSDYTFEKTNYGDIQVWCDANGNKEYKYELFVWSLKHYFQLKLYVHVIKFIKKEEYNIG